MMLEVFNKLRFYVFSPSAGSVDANFTIMFLMLDFTDILAMEEALFINRSLGNMTVGYAAWQFGEQSM